MAEQTKNYKNLRALSNYYFEITKKWWALTWYFKLAVFIIGLVAVFFPNISIWITIAVGLVSLTSEGCNIYSNYNKGKAESLLRKLDLQDSFGWEIKSIDVADVVVSLPKKLQGKFSPSDERDDYFASNETAGHHRAVQNLQESAWWSKHLAKTMGNYCAVLTIVLIVISLFTLIISSMVISSGEVTNSHAEYMTSANRVVIALLLLIVSLGLIPLTMNYNTFSTKAGESERNATELVRRGDDDEVQAIKAFNEYHLARASAPLIPTRLWERKKDGLNKAWKDFVASQR
jgi:hypothetical protein